jgi:hypothetical protein
MTLLFDGRAKIQLPEELVKTIAGELGLVRLSTEL